MMIPNEGKVCQGMIDWLSNKSQLSAVQEVEERVFSDRGATGSASILNFSLERTL